MDEVIDEIVADLASGLIDASDEEIAARLDEYGLDDADKADVIETIKQVREAESLADANIDPINIDNIDSMADAEANKMAQEDNTEVVMTEEDKDGDGDIDKVEIEKSDTDGDDKQMFDSFQDFMEEEDNASQEEDKPHGEKLNSNVIAGVASHKY